MRKAHPVLALFALSIVLLACSTTAPSGSDPSTTGGTASPQPTQTKPPPTPTTIPTPIIEVPTSFQDEGRTLYLESESVRVGVDSRWGGAIREIWFEGENIVNNYDGGRLIGVAFYDSDQLPASSHPNDTGWNPTPSDMYDHANPPLESSFDGSSLYLKHRYLQWFPDDKGGGASRAIETDIVVETWMRFFSDRQIIELRYRITNQGDVSHAVHAQEFPFAYVRTPFSRFVTYAGDRPWMGEDAHARNIPMGEESGGLSVASERWAGLVNEQGNGLVLWAPQTYPNVSYKHFNNAGPAENDSLYLLPRAFLAIKPHDTIETQAYILVGDWERSRERIYMLQESIQRPDIMHPYGFIDTPSSGTEVSGSVDVSGWAIDDRGIDHIEVRVDGEPAGVASYGNPRPDVERNYPAMPDSPNYGYAFNLDTHSLGGGEHLLSVVAIDAAGNSSVLRPGSLRIVVAQ